MTGEIPMSRVATRVVLIWVGAAALVVAWAVALASGDGVGWGALALGIVAIALAWRATAGARWALVMLIFVGVFLLVFAALWSLLLIAFANGDRAFEQWLVLAILPAFGGLSMVVGSGAGLRARNRRPGADDASLPET
jgi:hypothetical protein